MKFIIRKAAKNDVSLLQNLNNEVFIDNAKYDDDLILDWARENGFQKLFVNAYFNNHNAVRFYKKNGFSEIDISLEQKI